LSAEERGTALVVQPKIAKTIRAVRIVVPLGSGGTYHLYCQILSRYLDKFLGKNTSVVTHDLPGAGGIKAARYILPATPKNDIYIAMINQGSIAMPGLRKDVGLETLKMSWLGAMSGRAYGAGVYTGSRDASGTAAKSLAAKFGADQDGNVAYCDNGTPGKASTNYLTPAFMNKTLGTKCRIILGYKNCGTMNLAMQKAEIEDRGNFYTSYLGVWPKAILDKLNTFLARNVTMCSIFRDWTTCSKPIGNVKCSISSR